MNKMKTQINPHMIHKVWKIMHNEKLNYFLHFGNIIMIPNS